MNKKLLNILLLATIIFGQVQPIAVNATEISDVFNDMITEKLAEQRKKASEAEKKAEDEAKKKAQENAKRKSTRALTSTIPMGKYDNLDELRQAKIFNLITGINTRPKHSGSKYKPYNDQATSANYTIKKGQTIKPGELVIDFPKILSSRYTGKKFDLKVTFIMNTASPADIDLGVNTSAGLTIGYKVPNIRTTIPLRAEYAIYDSTSGKKIDSMGSMFVMDYLGDTYSTSVREDSADMLITTHKTTTEMMDSMTVDGKPLEFFWGKTGQDKSDNGTVIAVNSTPNKKGIPLLAVQSNRYLGSMFYTAYFSVGGSLSLNNIETSSKEPVAGVEYEVLYNGAVKGTYTTTASGNLDIFLDEGNYTIRQKSVPEGYIIDPTPRNFTVNANEVTELNFSNKHYGEKVVIHNVNNNSPEDAIDGSTFKIVDQDNKVVAENLKPGKDGLVTTDWLNKGKYKLVQTDYDSEKYEKADDINFEITTDGTGSKKVLKAVNEVKGSFKLKLVDFADGSKGLAGGTFDLLKDGTKVETLTTDSDGNSQPIYVLPGTYQLKQTKAPNNYYFTNDVINIEIKKGELSSKTISNKPQPYLNYFDTKITSEDPKLEIAGSEEFLYTIEELEVPVNSGAKKLELRLPEGVLMGPESFELQVFSHISGYGDYEPTTKGYKAVYDDTSRNYTITFDANSTVSQIYKVKLKLTMADSFTLGKTGQLTSKYDGTNLVSYEIIGKKRPVIFNLNAKHHILVDDEVADLSSPIESATEITYEIADLFMPENDEKNTLKATIMNTGSLSLNGSITVDYRNSTTDNKFVAVDPANLKITPSNNASLVTITAPKTTEETEYRIRVPMRTNNDFYGNKTTQFMTILEATYDKAYNQELKNLVITSSEKASDYLVTKDAEIKVENAWVQGFNYSYIQLKGSKQIYSTGVNLYGVLGTGETQSETTYVPAQFNPPLPEDEYVIQLEMALDCTAVLTNKGNVYYTGYSHYNQRPAFDSNNPITGIPASKMFSKVQMPEKIKKIGLNTNALFYLTESGKLYGNGRNDDYAISSNYTSAVQSNALISSDVSDFVTEGTIGTHSNRQTVFYKQYDTWYVRGADVGGRTATSYVDTYSTASIKGQGVIKPDRKAIKEIYPYTTGVLIQTTDDMLYSQGSPTVIGGHPGGLDKNGQQRLTKVKFWRDNSAGQTVDVTNNNLTVKKVHSAWLGTLVELSDGTFWFSGDNEWFGSAAGSSMGTGIYDPYTFMQVDDLKNTGLKAYRNTSHAKGDNISFANGVKKFETGWSNGLYIDNNDVLRVVSYDANSFGYKDESKLSMYAQRQWHTISGLVQINENKNMKISSDNNSNVEGESEGAKADLPNKITVANPYLIDKTLSPNTSSEYWPYTHIDIKDETGKVINSTDIATEEKKATNYTIPTNLIEFDKEYTVSSYFHTKNNKGNANYQKSNTIEKTFKINKAGAAKAYVDYYGEKHYDEVKVSPAEYFYYNIEGLEYKKGTTMTVEFDYPEAIKLLHGDVWSAVKVYRRPLGTNDEFKEDTGAGRECSAANVCKITVADWNNADYEYLIKVHAFADYSAEPGAKAPINARVTYGSGQTPKNINTVNIIRDEQERDPLEPYPYFMHKEIKYSPNLLIEAGDSFIYNIDNINVDNDTYGGGRNLIVPIPKYLEIDNSQVELYRRPMGSWREYDRVYWPAPTIADGKAIFPMTQAPESFEYRIRIPMKSSPGFPDATKTIIKPYIKYDDVNRQDKLIQESIVYTEGANLNEDTTITETNASAYTTRQMTGTQKYPIRMGTFPGEGFKYVSENINVPDVSDLTGIEFLLKMTDPTDLATFKNKMDIQKIKVERTDDEGETYSQIDSANITISYPSATEINVEIGDSYKAGSSYRITYEGNMLLDELSDAGLNLTGFVKYNQGVMTTPFELSPINIYGLKPLGLAVETVMGQEDIKFKASSNVVNNYTFQYQYRISNCSSCGDFKPMQTLQNGKISIPITNINDITGRNSNKFYDYENIELKLFVNGRSLGTTTLKRWYPASPEGTVSQMNDQVNPIAQITTYDLGINQFGKVNQNYGVETFTRNSLTTQTVYDGKLRVDNALTVSTAVPDTRAVPSTWSGINKEQLVNVDLTSIYPEKASFKLYLPPRYVDKTLEEDLTKIDNSDYKAINFDLTNYMSTSPKLDLSKQYVIEKYSGRIYNKEHGNLFKEEVDPYAIADGSNDARDQDFLITDTVNNQFLVKPDQRSLHRSGKVYYGYDNFGLNKVSYQVSRTVKNEKEMFGFFKRDAKYYFTNTKASNEVRACLIDNECDEISNQSVLFEGRVTKGSYIKQQIRTDHSKINSYKGLNEWIDEYMQ